MTIDTADHVLHRPSGEIWVVAYVREDRLAWCGWPEGTAKLADCELVTKATPDSRNSLLRHMADSNRDDSRVRYAKWVIATNDAQGYHRAMLAERARFEQQAQAARGERV